jgi:RNA polymerase sigma-70 factor, ECF subfamily
MPVSRRDTDDEERFTALFHRHRDAVHAFLVGRTADRAVAADLVQETFLRLWRRLPEADSWDDDRTRAWLFTVARNLAVDHFRASAARPAVSVAEVHDTASAADDPEERVAFGDDLARIDAAIAALPEDLREVLTMATMTDMSSTQIADSLGIPAGTVRSRLHDARRRLATVLDGGRP